MKKNNDWELLISDTNLLDIQLKEYLLKQNGIKYFVNLNKTDSAHGLSFGSDIKLFVLKTELKKAKKIIE